MERYHLRFDAPDIHRAGMIITRVATNGATLTRVPPNLDYQVCCENGDDIHYSDWMTSPQSGTIIVGDGSTELDFYNHSTNEYNNYTDDEDDDDDDYDDNYNYDDDYDDDLVFYLFTPQ